MRGKIFHVREGNRMSAGRAPGIVVCIVCTYRAQDAAPSIRTCTQKSWLLTGSVSCWLLACLSGACQCMLQGCSFSGFRKRIYITHSISRYSGQPHCFLEPPLRFHRCVSMYPPPLAPPVFGPPRSLIVDVVVLSFLKILLYTHVTLAVRGVSDVG